jgi:hypothetical protein
MSAHQKLSLQHHLASILNLSPTDDDDYISEILDQLLSIENAEDVAEYLGNFVADESAGDVAMFVEELGRFKSGTIAASTASVAAVNPDEQGEKVQTPSSGNRILDEGAAQREEIRLRELEAREKQRMEQERLRMKKEEETRRQKEAESRNTTRSLQSKWEMKVESNAANNNANQTVPLKQKDAVKQPPKKKAVEQTAAAKKVDTIPSKPLKGTPKTICGCFGNKHAPLTNCLHCGRISCEREGYDYCPFCNNLITQFTPSSNSKYDSALAHKERLLEYDRTSASRTHVHDDQEDYFVTQSSMWSSAQEQEEASALEEERRKKLHHRGNQVLDITF